MASVYVARTGDRAAHDCLVHYKFTKGRDPLKGGTTVFQEMSILLVIIAALLYLLRESCTSIAKMTTGYTGCSACEAPHMIPIDSPRGQKLLEGDER